MTKLLHKNASFWRRFIANLIDFLLFSLLTIGLWKLLNLNSIDNQIKISSWYTFLVFSWAINAILFIVIPYFWNYRTIGLLVSRLQVLPKTKKHKLVKCLIIFSPGFAFYSLIVLLMLVGIWPSQVKNLYISDITQLNNLKWNLVFLARLVSVLSGAWTMFILLNYGLILASKKRSGLFERIFYYRIAYIKHYTQSDKLKQIKLIPSKVEKIEIIFMEDKND
ncbi:MULTISPECIES: RDD family protein [unclassified Mycoplasma]|uniref:RDD family protein n=1 Tax=unclassified Mycoplasma TaxID=2683645 RepID=UPI00216B5AF8|nr:MULTISPECIES: RDD family protein [unclassified Mycoplasma]MCS4537084.1 RDD family protein [Mycoplasma sp. CSL7475-4]MCT4469772.1 RDD family protein [Mycoplasma sp. HS2188]